MLWLWLWASPVQFNVFGHKFRPEPLKSGNGPEERMFTPDSQNPTRGGHHLPLNV